MASQADQTSPRVEPVKAPVSEVSVVAAPVAAEPSEKTLASRTGKDLRRMVEWRNLVFRQLMFDSASTKKSRRAMERRFAV